MELADAHIHLFAQGFHGRYGRPSSGGDDLLVYETLRQRHNVGCALVIGYEGADVYLGNNEHIAGLSRTHPWISPAAYLPPWPPPEPADIDGLAAQGFCGLVLYVSTPEVARLLAKWPDDTLSQIARAFRLTSLNAAAAATAELSGFVGSLAPCTILFSHTGLPGRFSRPPTGRTARQRIGALLDLAVMEHVGVKLSAYYGVSEPRDAYPNPRAQPFVDALLEHFGSRRLYWGSDYSPSLDWVSFGQTVDLTLPAGLSPADTRRIMGGNLRRLLDDVR